MAAAVHMLTRLLTNRRPQSSPYSRHSYSCSHARSGPFQTLGLEGRTDLSNTRAWKAESMTVRTDGQGNVWAAYFESA
jgi:hypothetical protein